MRRPTPLRTALLLAAALLVVAGSTGCGDDDDVAPATTTAAPTTSAAGTDPALEALLVRAEELPAGFSPAAGDVDDTITAFCANEDAAAGLQATARAIAGHTREPAGASVIHLVYRFRPGHAARFVQQATDILERCRNVPDASGLAFDYGPAADAVEVALTGTDAHVARYGTSVGSSSLSIGIAVFRDGDVGHLVAVLGVDMARADLDALAQTAVTAAVAP